MHWLRVLVIGALLTTTAVGVWAGEIRAGEIRALFSPWDDVEGALITELGNARHSIDVQAYLLTSKPITRALLSAHQRGVQVRVLADGEMAQRAGGESLAALARAGVPVWLETRYAAAHNKVLLIDAGESRPVVITGSYNFTWSAQARNAENVLIVSGDTDLARRYAGNWQRHYAEATAFVEPDPAQPRKSHEK